VDTNDIVQLAMTRSLRHLDRFESLHEGALLMYLRQAVLNQIRDQARRVARRPETGPVPEDLAAPGPSPLENAIRGEMLARYETGLERLTPPQREAVVLRLEMGYTHPQVAEAIGVASADAARMLVSRALVRLAEEMEEDAGEDR
jgi:RNA polymerase sigma-70 factor (ECF subfamily)